MSLFEKLKSDRIQAMKDKSEVKKNILGCVIAESSKQDKIPNDDKVISTIRKFVSGIEETIKIFEKEVERTDFQSDCVDCNDWKKYELEKTILESYLPKQFGKDDLILIIEAYRDLGNEMTMKAIMNHFQTHMKNQYDGKILSEITKQIINGNQK